MQIWHRGSLVVTRELGERVVSIDEFMETVGSRKIPRVPGTAVFLTRTASGAPPVMVWHVEHNRALHERLLVLRVVTESVPRTKESERLSIIELAPNFWRATARYRFMERPDIPSLVRQAHMRGCPLDLDDITYYVGHETIVRREDGTGLAEWEATLFAAMERNAAHVSDFFRLPSGQVVEIGRQVAI